MENTNVQMENMAAEEVKLLFAREEARKHGHEFANAEDEKVAAARFDCLSQQDRTYWTNNVYEIERQMVKFGTRDLRLFYPKNGRGMALDPAFRRHIGRNFHCKSSR